MTHHRLYRHFAQDGALLYIGITQQLGWRQLAHERAAPWWCDVRRIEVEPYRSRAEVEAAEVEAIKVEKPRYNRQHNEHTAPRPMSGLRLTAAGRRASTA